MSITILSPHSGQPIKVRDQDIGRAIRDEGGRLFYVVARTDGNGHYGSLTRKGSPADEARYDNQDWKLPQDQRTAQATQSSASAPAPAHDATGKRKASPVRIIALLLALAVIAVGGWFAYRALTSDTAAEPAPLIEPLPNPDSAPPPELPTTPEPGV